MSTHTFNERAGAAGEPAGVPGLSGEPAGVSDEPVAPERPRRFRGFLRVLRTILVLTALLAAAAFGGTHVLRERLAEQHFVQLGNAVLTAEPVAVGTADAGVVSEMLVTEQADVRAGQDLAKVTLTASDPSRTPPVRVLRAPQAGTVSAISVAVGGVVRAGEPVLTLYDPAGLTFQAQVPIEQLRQLRLGMSVSVTGPGLREPVPAKLDRVIPRVGSDAPAATDRLTVVLVPEPGAADAVRTLVPGLQFRATVDTRTAAGATPAVNSAG